MTIKKIQVVSIYMEIRRNFIHKIKILIMAFKINFQNSFKLYYNKNEGEIMETKRVSHYEDQQRLIDLVINKCIFQGTPLIGYRS